MKAIAAIGRPDAVSPASARPSPNPQADRTDFLARLQDARAAAQTVDGLASAARVDAGRADAARADAARDTDMRAASRRQWAMQTEHAPRPSTDASARRSPEGADAAAAQPEAASRSQADRLAAERRASARPTAPRPQQAEAPRRGDEPAQAMPAAPAGAEAAPAEAGTASTESQATATTAEQAPQAGASGAPPAAATPGSSLLDAWATPIAPAQAADGVAPDPEPSASPATREAAGQGAPIGQTARSAPEDRTARSPRPDGTSVDAVADGSGMPMRPDARAAGETASTVGLASQRAAEPAARSGSTIASFTDALAAVQQAASPIGGPSSGVPALPEPPLYAVREPVGTAAFAPALSERVVALAIDGLESAQLTVSPPELGPVRIELSLSGESAAVAFSALQPETRRAIEQSLPVLRDLLAEHGMRLADARVDIGSGAFAGQGEPHRFGQAASGRSAPERAAAPQASGVDGTGPARSVRQLAGRLDLFA